MATPRLFGTLLLACALVLGGLPAWSSAAGPPEGARRAAGFTVGCSTATPYRLAMFTNGIPEPDLFLCTDYWRSRSVVVNESRTRVWYLSTHREQPYWLPDRSQPVQTQLFRAAMRRHFASRGGRPYLTFEPGTRVVLQYAPSTVSLRMDPQEQAAWQTVVMAVSTTRRVALGAAPTVLGAGSPTRRAVVSCAISGYKAGSLLTQQEPAKELAKALGLASNAAACGRALDRAASRSAPELAVTSDDLSRTAFARRWLVKNRSSLIWSMAEQVAKHARVP